MKGKTTKVAVLLATYNGAAHLPEQLQSIADQKHSSIDVWLSDDGSTDNTVEIAQTYAKNWPKGSFNVLVKEKPATYNLGHPFDNHLAACNRNFHSLVTNPKIVADYYAFCDQDDVWENDKLTRAVDWIAAQDPDVPAMYCSRATIINEQGIETGKSILFAKPPCFSNAIIQNIAAGNTIVMNGAAFEAVRSSMNIGEFVSHDWWVYMVVTALGGKVKYDIHPTIRYRQHASNLIGENASWRARMIRFRFVMNGRFSAWNNANLRGLSRLYPRLGASERAVIDTLHALRRKGPVKRIMALYRSPIHRQTWIGQLSLYIACLLDKI